MNRYFLTFTFIFITFNLFSQTYEDLVSKSADYIEAKEYEAAEETLKQAMRKEPGNAGNILLLSNLGTIQRNLGKPGEALLSYTTALSKYPNNIPVLQNRAALLCEMDSLNAAMGDYNIILSLDEDNMEALYRRGLIHIEQKNFLAAETDLEQVISINSNHIPAQNSIAFIMKSKGEWKDAEEKYTDLIYKYKSHPDFYINRAECYLHLNKLARSKADLQKAIDLKSENPLLYIIRGQLNIQQFDKFAARQDFMKAQDLGADKKLIEGYLHLCK